MTCTTVPSCTLLRLPILIQFTSPRMTTHIQTLLSSPISTSPITWAESSMNTLEGTRGMRPRCGRIIDENYTGACTSRSHEGTTKFTNPFFFENGFVAFVCTSCLREKPDLVCGN